MLTSMRYSRRMGDLPHQPSCFDQAWDAAKSAGLIGITAGVLTGSVIGAVVTAPVAPIGIYLGGAIGGAGAGLAGFVGGGSVTFAGCQLSDAVAQMLPPKNTTIATRHR